MSALTHLKKWIALKKIVCLSLLIVLSCDVRMYICVPTPGYEHFFFQVGHMCYHCISYFLLIQLHTKTNIFYISTTLIRII
jgi:hypothetical protein